MSKKEIYGEVVQPDVMVAASSNFSTAMTVSAGVVMASLQIK
jgi:hypothetical protein